MDQINVKNSKADDVADDFLKAELQAKREENSLSALKDWEMVLASGGEPAVSWG